MALLSGLQSYWELDEASGNRADKVGGITLTDTNTVGSTSGLGGTVATFVQTNSEQLSSTTLPYTGTPGTISCWWNLSASSANEVDYIRMLGSTDDGGAAALWWMRTWHGADSEATLYTYLNDSVGVENQYQALEVGTWYHTVITYTSELATYYHNAANTGWVSATKVLAGSIVSPVGNSKFVIGGLDAHCFYGEMAKVGIWNRVLEASEIAALYNSGTPPSYPFGEGAGPNPGSIWPTVTM